MQIRALGSFSCESINSRHSWISSSLWVNKLLHPLYFINFLNNCLLKHYYFLSIFCSHRKSYFGIKSLASSRSFMKLFWNVGAQGRIHSFPICMMTIFPVSLRLLWAALKKADWSLLKWKLHLSRIKSNSFYYRLWINYSLVSFNTFS